MLWFIAYIYRNDNDKGQLNGKRILDAPIHIGDISKKADELKNEQNSIWMSQNVEDTSLVIIFLLKKTKKTLKQFWPFFAIFIFNILFCIAQRKEGNKFD